MFIIGTDWGQKNNSPLDYIPLRLRKYFFDIDCSKFFEIRLRCGNYLAVNTQQGIKYVTHKNKLSSYFDDGIIITKRDIDEALDIITDSSLYSYIDEIKSGFFTIPGGHRVGICGTIAQDSEFVVDINSLNYRFAREMTGVAEDYINKIVKGNSVDSTLITSQPGGGKTTFLRDLIRCVSDKGLNVSLIDERGEIAACYDGMPVFNIGKNTDVMSMCSKSKGMEMMLRTMTPDVIAVDEFDFLTDYQFLSMIVISGVSLFATAHCQDYKKEIPTDVLKHFKHVIVLSDKHHPGVVEEIIDV